MKTIILNLTFFFCFVSFQSSSQSTFKYEIKGEIKGLKNDTLYLSIKSVNTANPEKILIAASNDKFSYKGQADKPVMVWAQTTAKRGDNGNFTFFIEEGKIKIDGSNDDLTHTRVIGTPNNNDYSYVNSRMNNYYDKIKSHQKKLKQVGDSSAAAYKTEFKQIGILYDSIILFQNEFVADKPNSLASGMLLLLIADKMPVQKLEKYYLSLGEHVKELSILSKMPVKIEGKKRSVIGSPAPDFTMKDVNGKNITLSDYRGKYVLLDFWASWCVPCRKDNPYVKAAYEKFKDKDFVIIGVSLDENGVNWKKAIEKDQLPWIHISDFKKENEVAMLYGVQPIPDNFLISPEGKIIERGLHGNEVEKILAGYLK
ncbi:MAG: TlpA disulfide reductase family protein [Bacteroidota bacterium]|nr:TlpA disulfide reductase family protein [Bacteroidota bacterium]